MSVRLGCGFFLCHREGQSQDAGEEENNQKRHVLLLRKEGSSYVVVAPRLVS
jgi:hypothetical protein